VQIHNNNAPVDCVMAAEELPSLSYEDSGDMQQPLL